MSNDEKIYFSEEKAQQGTDCYTFEIRCKKDVDAFETVELINKHGRSYGCIKTVRGTLLLHLVLPHYVRENNIEPFGLWDDCKSVSKEICEQLKRVLGNNFISYVRSVECNITQRVSSNAVTSDVLNLLNHALLSSAKDNLEYSGSNKKCVLKKEIHTVIFRKAHYYTLKAYDKTEEYRKKCKEHEGKKADIVDNVLRIEIILLGRTIDRLFGFNTSVYDILSEESLIEIMREYKRIYIEEIIEVYIKPYLTKCKRKLVNSLLDKR